MTKPDIAAFVGSRLDEDDAAARAALGWTAAYSSEDKDFAERFSPARALREVAALRAVLAALEAAQNELPAAGSFRDDRRDPGVSYMAGKIAGLQMAVKNYAAIWQDHPDYDERWKP